jgi:hypothetical protein
MRLSGKQPDEFGPAAEAVDHARARLGDVADLGCQVVWETPGGLPFATLHLQQAYAQTWMSFQLAKRRGGAQDGTPGRAVLRELHLRGYEHATVDPQLRWFVGYVQDSCSWSGMVHHGFPARHQLSGEAACVPLHAYEIATDRPVAEGGAPLTRPPTRLSSAMPFGGSETSGRVRTSRRWTSPRTASTSRPLQHGGSPSASGADARQSSRTIRTNRSQSRWSRVRATGCICSVCLTSSVCGRWRRVAPGPIPCCWRRRAAGTATVASSGVCCSWRIRARARLPRSACATSGPRRPACSPQGWWPNSRVDAFLVEGGPADLLVEECDSLDIKLLLRERARAHRIPVVMETSDRGMLDVERHDLEPDRPILHGLVGSLSAADLGGCRGGTRSSTSCGSSSRPRSPTASPRRCPRSTARCTPGRSWPPA